MEHTQIAEFAKNIALETGELLRESWNNAELKLTSKGFRDIVTDADFASQKLVTERVMQTFPTHGFLSEEDDGSLPTEGDVIWIIDPIDGTSNFARKSPLFCVSIAATWPTDDPFVFKPFVGIVYDPVRNELFLASKGSGATLNNRPISVSGVATLDSAIIAFDWPREPAIRQTTLETVTDTIHNVKTMRSIGSAALGLCYVASGRLDGYFNYHLSPWDVAAGELIITEAGGAFSDMTGEQWRGDVKTSLGSNGLVHQSLIGLGQNKST